MKFSSTGYANTRSGKLQIQLRQDNSSSLIMAAFAGVLSLAIGSETLLSSVAQVPDRATDGWKENHDQRNWFDYQYRVVWSFFGGHQFQTEWTSSALNEIQLFAPLRRQLIELQFDPATLAKHRVRSITVTLLTKVGARTQKKRVSLSPINAAPAPVEILLPIDQDSYEYEISWRLSGNRQIKSGRQTTEETLLFLDDLPLAANPSH